MRMAEYYVIRDKSTGLYFRGKGANRWGKHYNQATIYRVRGTAEHSIKEIAWHGEQAEIVPIQIFENPTDMVEAVRCKDCRFCEVVDETQRYFCRKPLGAIGYIPVKPDDFCSYGEERKMEEK